MKGPKSTLVLIIGMSLVAGCRLDGTWAVIEFNPPPREASPVPAAISFSRDGRYALTESIDNASTSSTGRYSWNGSALKLVADDDGERTYPCRFNWDFSLRVVNHSADDPWVATLRRDE